MGFEGKKNKAPKDLIFCWIFSCYFECCLGICRSCHTSGRLQKFFPDIGLVCCSLCRLPSYDLDICRFCRSSGHRTLSSLVTTAVVIKSSVFRNPTLISSAFIVHSSGVIHTSHVSSAFVVISFRGNGKYAEHKQGNRETMKRRIHLFRASCRYR